jgi:hypothetical protein
MEARFLLRAQREPMRGKPIYLTSYCSAMPELLELPLGTGAGALNWQPTLNVLIHHWFDSGPHKYVKISFALQHGTLRFANKDFTGELFFPH